MRLIVLLSLAAVSLANPLTSEEKDARQECNAQCSALKADSRARVADDRDTRQEIKSDQQHAVAELKKVRKDIRDGTLTTFKQVKDELREARIKDLDQFLNLTESDYLALKAQIDAELAEILALLENDRTEAGAELQAKLNAAQGVLDAAYAGAQAALDVAVAALDNCAVIPTTIPVLVWRCNYCCLPPPWWCWWCGWNCGNHCCGWAWISVPNPLYALCQEGNAAAEELALVIFNQAIAAADLVWGETREEAYDYLEFLLADIAAAEAEAANNATLAQSQAFQDYQAIVTDPIQPFLDAKASTRQDFTENNAIAADLKVEEFGAASDAYRVAVELVEAEVQQRLAALYADAAAAEAAEEAAQALVCEADCYEATTEAPTTVAL